MRITRHLETDLPPRGAASTGASTTLPSGGGGVTVTWADPDAPLPPSSVDRDVLLSWKRQALSDIVSDLQWRVARLLDDIERAPVR